MPLEQAPLSDYLNVTNILLDYLNKVVSFVTLIELEILQDKAGLFNFTFLL